MFEEVDFTKEIRNMKEFGAYLDDTGMRSVATVPFVYEQVVAAMSTEMSHTFVAPTCPSPVHLLLSHPNVHPALQLSSRRVLVMERLYGVPLSDLGAIRQVTTKEPELVLIAALNTWLTSLASCRSFHADLHAGNMLVLR